MFERQRFLDLLHHFIVFEENPDSCALHKIIAGYHQFHAVNAAVEETVRASGMSETGSVLREDAGTYWAGRQRGGKPGDRRAGVVWHTQGSGKSFSMLFYAARVVRHPAMQSPTLVVLTDRNDLNDQLFGQFQRCADILGQTPVQADGQMHLRELLNRASGRVVLAQRGAEALVHLRDFGVGVVVFAAHRQRLDGHVSTVARDLTPRGGAGKRGEQGKVAPVSLAAGAPRG